MAWKTHMYGYQKVMGDLTLLRQHSPLGAHQTVGLHLKLKHLLQMEAQIPFMQRLIMVIKVDGHWVRQVNGVGQHSLWNMNTFFN